MAIRPLEMLWLGFLFGSCAEPSTAPLPPATIAADCPPTVHVADTEGPPASAKPTAASRATNAYHGLQEREANAVTAPAATASYVRAIHTADDLARTALRELIAQDGHPTDAAIAKARASIEHLVGTLENTQGGGAM